MNSFVQSKTFIAEEEHFSSSEDNKDTPQFERDTQDMIAENNDLFNMLSKQFTQQFSKQLSQMRKLLQKKDKEIKHLNHKVHKMEQVCFFIS